MSVVQSNQIFIVGGTANIPGVSTSTFQPVQNVRRPRFKNNGHQSICDFIVVLVALPSLTVLGLMLESLTRENWLETPESRMTVLALAAGIAVIGLALCIYVTSRLGKKFLWVGMQYSSDTVYSYYNPRVASIENTDLPPKYDVAMGYEMAPPAYDTIIDIEKLQFENGNIYINKCPKENTIQYI